MQVRPHGSERVGVERRRRRNRKGKRKKVDGKRRGESAIAADGGWMCGVYPAQMSATRMAWGRERQVECVLVLLLTLAMVAVSRRRFGDLSGKDEEMRRVCWRRRGG